MNGLKALGLTIALMCFLTTAKSQTNTRQVVEQTANVKVALTDELTQVVEASCGQCQFGLKGKSCDLAVRIKGKPYFVDGTGIDDHGDAHAKDGFCQKIRKAEIRGKIVKGRFHAVHFKLLPDAEPK